MKKSMIFLIILAMTFSLMVGCSKKDDAEELQLGEVNEESQEEVTEADSEISTPEEIDYVLYLKYKDKPFLYDDLFTVNINDERLKNKSIEEFVINELIAYSKDGGLVSPIPSGTKVLKIERDDKTVIVDFSKEFIHGNPSQNDALLTLGGLVNTLVILPGNETVKIYVEGSPLNSFHGVDTSEPLNFFDGVFADK